MISSHPLLFNSFTAPAPTSSSVRAVTKTFQDTGGLYQGAVNNASATTKVEAAWRAGV
jgi:hypothetical protein